MKVKATNFSSPRGRGTAGFFLGIFLLVGLAAMTATPTSVLAGDGDVEAPKGLRGAPVEAPGAERGAEAPHVSDLKGSFGENDGSEGGFLSSAKSGTDSKGEADNVQRIDSPGWKAREKSSSPAAAAPAEPAVPSEAPRATLVGTRPEAAGSEANPRPGDPEQQSYEGKKEQGHLSSEESSRAAGATSNAEKAPAGASEDVRTRGSSSQEAAVEERVQQPPPADSSSPSAIIPSSKTTALTHDGVDGVRVMNKESPTPPEDEVDKGQLPSSFSPVSAVTTPTPASDSEGIVHARNVRATVAGEPAGPDGGEEKAGGLLPGVPGSGLAGSPTQKPGVQGAAAAVRPDAPPQDNENGKNPVIADRDGNKQHQAGSSASAAVPGGAPGQEGAVGDSHGHGDTASGSQNTGSASRPVENGVQNPDHAGVTPGSGAGNDRPTGSGDSSNPHGESESPKPSQKPQGGDSGSSGTGQGSGQQQNDPKPESQQGDETSTVSPSSSTTAPTTTTSNSTTYQRLWSTAIGLLTVVPFLLTA